MAVVDSVFLAVGVGSSEVAGWLVAGCAAEVVATEAGVVRLRVRGAVVGDWVGVVVQPNEYVLRDAEPDEVQAMDAYGVEVQVRAGGSEDALHREADVLFGKLVEARPEVPMLLVQNLESLVKAHLPGAGTHTFDPPITPDAEDAASWRSWIST